MQRLQRSEKFVEHIEGEVEWLSVSFAQQPMTEVTDVLQIEHESGEKCHIFFKEFDDLEKGKVKDHCYYRGL